jgi:hypothetical protein
MLHPLFAGAAEVVVGAHPLHGSDERQDEEEVELGD